MVPDQVPWQRPVFRPLARQPSARTSDEPSRSQQQAVPVGGEVRVRRRE
jgi:hypothetical protein